MLSPELITAGNAINSADAVELKMMAQSDDIMAALTDSIISIKPTLVLLTGDLTHNGERASHERMAQHLERMAQQDIQALVIPGNHDCNNPGAKRFDGDQTLPTATVTRDEFAQIYRNYGYGKGSRRDPASLSYCCEPVKGVVVIGIDSNMDELNQLTSRGDSTNTYYNSGRIKPETLQWVIEQATNAKQQGKQVIAMMHHHLVPHFDNEERLLANYIVNHHDNVAHQLMEAGIHAIFTGHLHVTDAPHYIIMRAPTASSRLLPARPSAIPLRFAPLPSTVSTTRWLSTHAGSQRHSPAPTCANWGANASSSQHLAWRQCCPAKHGAKWADACPSSKRC